MSARGLSWTQFPDSRLRWSPAVKNEQIMNARTRKHFSGAFKATVALEAIRGGKRVHAIAQEYGVHPTQVGPWTKDL